MHWFRNKFEEKKWEFFTIYRLPIQSEDNSFENLGRALDH